MGSKPAVVGQNRRSSREGRATTNFERTLPPAQSELAISLLKDPYNFDFLGLTEDARERDLHRGLLQNLRELLLELGAGFAFVGSEVHLEVGGDDFYLSVVDDLLRHPDDRPSIGLVVTARAPAHARPNHWPHPAIVV